MKKINCCENDSRVLGAIGDYSYTWGHGTTEGWATCSTWNLEVGPGMSYQGRLNEGESSIQLTSSLR
jgi:hypothetical protein